jgi:hypothetical protein
VERAGTRLAGWLTETTYENFDLKRVDVRLDRTAADANGGGSEEGGEEGRCRGGSQEEGTKTGSAAFGPKGTLAAEAHREPGTEATCHGKKRSEAIHEESAGDFAAATSRFATEATATDGGAETGGANGEAAGAPAKFGAGGFAEGGAESSKGTDGFAAGSTGA